MSSKRKDTLSLKRIDIFNKEQLADSLGEAGKEYWAVLKSFLAGNCSKEDLDAKSAAVFTTPHQAKIHNKLLSAIMYNLTPNIPTPQGIDQDFVIKNFKRRKAQDILMGQHIKKKFNRQCIIQMPTEERKRLSEIEHSTPFPVDQSIEYPKGIEGIPKTCSEDGDIPSHEALRTRMKFISAFHGLDGNFSNDAVVLLNQALQNYLKNLMDSVIQKSPSSASTVTLDHLTFAIQMTPQQLDSDLIETIGSNLQT